MNKKLLYVLPLLAIVLVSAAIIDYYGLFQQEIEVTQPVTINSRVEYSGSDIISDAIAGETRRGTPLEISSDVIRTVTISSSEEEGIITSYIAELQLSKKIVEFGNAPWVLTEEPINVEYTVVGDNFKIEVVDEDKEEGYVLIYYADNPDRFNDVSTGIDVKTITENLPFPDEENAEGGDYNYCDIDGEGTLEYNTCHGAKLWYIDEDAITDGVIDWSQASNFYFETELIQYNLGGEIIIYPNADLTIIPVYELDSMLDSGTYTINTTIA